MPMLDLIKKEYNIDLKRTIMVGDRIDTDIIFGRNVYNYRYL